MSRAASNMLVWLFDLKDSAVFQQIWKAELKRVSNKGNNVTIDEIEQNIWQPSKRVWDAFCRGLVSTC